MHVTEFQTFLKDGLAAKPVLNILNSSSLVNYALVNYSCKSKSWPQIVAVWSQLISYHSHCIDSDLTMSKSMMILLKMLSRGHARPRNGGDAALKNFQNRSLSLSTSPVGGSLYLCQLKFITRQVSPISRAVLSLSFSIVHVVLTSNVSFKYLLSTLCHIQSI